MLKELHAMLVQQSPMPVEEVPADAVRFWQGHTSLLGPELRRLLMSPVPREPASQTGLLKPTISVNLPLVNNLVPLHLATGDLVSGYGLTKWSIDKSFHDVFGDDVLMQEPLPCSVTVNNLGRRATYQQMFDEAGGVPIPLARVMQFIWLKCRSDMNFPLYVPGLHVFPGVPDRSRKLWAVMYLVEDGLDVTYVKLYADPMTASSQFARIVTIDW
jgi:hypothetical protein